MPKGKNRKSRYARRAPAVQPTIQATTGTAPISTAGTANIVKPVTATPGKSTPRAVAVFSAPKIGDELKVIGILTVFILAAIIVLYFVLR